MTYEQAKNLIKINQHLIGQKIIGATIDELIIYPTDQKSYDEFFKIYLRTDNAEKAILPYQSQDVDIYCMADKKRARASGIVGHASLAKANKDLDVNFGEGN